MNATISYTLLLTLGLGFLLTSCGNPSSDNHSAYFGGEIINPKDKWVLLYYGDELIDSIPLDGNNRFFKKFDSLASGLYTFKHEPEYQYVYFDKNDSLMVRVNTIDFDESLVFCGKGEEKNNFLIEMYLKNQKDGNATFTSFDLDEKEFVKKTDSVYQEALDFYQDKKEHILWNKEFDIIAKAIVDFPYYSKKEFYPFAYMRRNQQNNYPELSSGYYDFRKNVDFNNEKLISFSPYIRYISSVIDNLVNIEGYVRDEKNALKRLSIADSIVENQVLKNKILNNIAFFHLLDNENNVNNKNFLEEYYKISTNDKQKNDIKDLTEAIRNISERGSLPEIILEDVNQNKVSSNAIFNGKTIMYFWSKKNESHFFAVHRKLNQIIQNNPKIDVIAISLDEDYNDWKSFLDKNKNIPHPKIHHYLITDFNDSKKKWVITRVTRASIIDQNAKIINGFVNIFDAQFDKKL